MQPIHRKCKPGQKRRLQTRVEFDETHFEVSTLGKDRFLAETRFMRNPKWRKCQGSTAQGLYADSSLSLQGQGAILSRHPSH